MSVIAHVVDESELLVIELWYIIKILLALFALVAERTVLIHSDQNTMQSDADGAIFWTMSRSSQKWLSRQSITNLAWSTPKQRLTSLRNASWSFLYLLSDSYSLEWIGRANIAHVAYILSTMKYPLCRIATVSVMQYWEVRGNV